MKEARKYFEQKYADVDQANTIEVAEKLFHTMRGSYIVGQTMHHGIMKMLEVEPKLRERSNIADAYLMLSLFFPYPDPEEVEGR
jgi:hypothetical protein